MKNALVIGATNFIGFSLCQKLISMEVEVFGLEFSEKENDQAEKKLMEIGRNAYFNYFNLDSLERGIELKDRSFEIAYFCFESEESLERNAMERLKPLLDKTQKILLVSPIANNLDVAEFQDITNHSNIFSVYHPSAYGPWQPESETIQQRIIELLNNNQLEKREILNDDILYVEDLVEAIFTISENTQVSTSVTLVNRDKGTLAEIAAELELKIKDKEFPKKLKKEEETRNVYYVSSSISVKKALAKQRNTTEESLKLDF
ncbi:hypothetical protein [Sutcliffiella deserti]|uniref:hypothetical protein n=1 Tax=Sutcliffiella deserti TaxID=2875501 RepID=UPI001CBB400C|nr:hypothetical protein [Sutcliffiella deserti]